MVTMKIRKNKFLVILIVFMMLFSNFGYTIAAIASSDEFEVISNGFFKKDEVKFKAYFEDESGKQTKEITKDVNEKAKLVVEILPQVEGYLKRGSIKAVSTDDDDINFKFASVTENLLEDRTEGKNILTDALIEDNSKEVKEPEKEVENQVPDETPIIENTVSDNIVDENLVEGDTNTVETETNTSLTDALLDFSSNPIGSSINPLMASEMNIVNEVADSSEVTNTVSDNPLLDTLMDENTNIIALDTQEPEKSGEEENLSEEPSQEDEVLEEDRLIDEEAIIEEKIKRARLEEEIRNAILDIKLASDNEISLSNIIKDTKIEIELEFVQKEKLNVEDLFKNIKLQMSGTYINRDLEEVKVGKEEEVTVGWEYTKDFNLESEFTKFSPFELEDIKGTIVENKITVEREIIGENFLPIKSTRLEIVAPKVNDKLPIKVDVVANRLLATRGEDSGYVIFTDVNWKYNEATGMINIFVENDNYVYSNGIDEYIIIYRYEDYVDSEKSNLLNNVRATITEFSGTQNNTLVKEINNAQDIKVDVGELVTYSIQTTEDKINKAKIYANYNSEEALYETLFTTQVNINILTSDILQQLKIDCTKEVYKDINGIEFDTKGIEYKSIKFDYAQISDLLSEGGEIVITNANNETLYVLNKEAITNENDCNIPLNGAKGIYIYANNVAKNGTINFEIIKAIKKCDFAKSVFKNITQIESRITAEVKYKNIEERIPLQTIAVTKNFEESKTTATLEISRDSLSTMKTNANVELRIILNNDKETSDLYVNPSFEIVFPKYVTEVGIESINLLNDCGLRVSDFETYTESDIVKMRLELSGTQTMFCENTLTNGTNIIINVNIEVDNYAPAKEDQIKLYYCNEGVSTYQSQTKWTVSKQIPNGILKTTNGFDVEMIKYQAPTGLVAINGIVNYDGQLGEVQSVKQGPVTKEIPINTSSRIATMELLVLNNTGNTCSDVVLLGRVPSKGIKDIISGEDLHTTTDTKMVAELKEDIQNGNMVDIYYSTNPTADKNLENHHNDWTKDIENISEVKSFLIVVKGNLEAGTVLRYTYDFEIPENLPYEAKIAGNFAAFYNNNKEEAVVAENSSADEVSLTTEAGPKIEATIKNNIGDGKEIGERRYVAYTIEVSNTGSIVAENVRVQFDRPENSTICLLSTDMGVGNDGYIESDSTLGFTWRIEKLNPGETKTYHAVAKTMQIMTNIDEAYIVAKTRLSAENLGIEIESNELRNKIVKSIFDMEVNSSLLSPIDSGIDITYNGTIVNISGETQRNVRAEWLIPSTVQFLDSDQDNLGWTYDAGRKVATMIIDEIAPNESKEVSIKVKSASGNKDEQTNYLSVISNDGTTERSSSLTILYRGVEIQASQTSNITSGNVLERGAVEFLIRFKNTGNGDGNEVTIFDEISPNLSKVSASMLETNQTLNIVDGKIEQKISLKIDEELTLKISGIAADLDGQSKTIVNKARIGYNVNSSIETNEIVINIEENSQKEEEPTPTQKPNQSTTLDRLNKDNLIPNSTDDEPTLDNPTVQNGIRKISGYVWVDKDKNGRKDSKDTTLPSIEVQLYKNNSMLKSTTTGRGGSYSFANLAEGEYYIVFKYDENKYKATEFQKVNVEEELNSKAVETTAGSATTSTIILGNQDIKNINLGLQEKDKFDLKVDKAISKATVIVNNKSEETEFDNVTLGKVEIKASQLKNAKVDLEYVINVSNVGDISGKALTIVDILPEDMTFDKARNEGWTLGNDGILYNSSLKEITIAPGESKQLKLVLTKVMNEENTGAVVNKIQLVSTESNSEQNEDIENNVATQEMLILIKTGETTKYILPILLLTIFIIGIYYNTSKLEIKNTYKNKDRTKISLKKSYK